MNKQDYSYEEKYQKNVKELKRAALMFFIIGFVFGGIVIGLGFVQSNSVDQNAINTLQVQINEEISNNGISLKYYELQDQLEKLKDQHNLSYDLYGAGITFFAISCIISSIMLFIAHRRNIIAFSIQQTIPVSKETMENMASSYKTVSKEIAKGFKEGLNDEENK